MNPQFESTRDLRSSQSAVESGMPGFDSIPGMSTPEQGTITGETTIQPPTITPAVLPTDIPSSTIVPIAPMNGQSASAVAVAGDDDDSIDEEWVKKAKAIVGQTREDPYQQSTQLGKAKAIYLKTHYDKDIKFVEEQPQ
jgi:hypothetical protein